MNPLKNHKENRNNEEIGSLIVNLFQESVSGAGAGAASGECEGEDQDEPSSSSESEAPRALSEALGGLNLQDSQTQVFMTDDKEDELSLFRSQWQRELENSPVHTKHTPKQEADEPKTEEDKAKQLFLKGVEYERSGKLYEAIQEYKRAMQILPDVETRLYESTEMRSETPKVESEIAEEIREEINPESDDEEAVDGEDLITRLRRVVARRGTLCEPRFPVKSAHISWLPWEVMQLVLRWVVSAELDAASLERVGAVCRGLYVAARDTQLWRSLCVKTWGIECGSPRAFGCGSWREMYIERPRVQLNGCYISKTTYLRHGENSFQDQFYRPWYLVDYYRYLRFFPDGLVLSWTTAEEPAACVSQLRSRTAPARHAAVMCGDYRLVGDKVVIVIKKSSEEIHRPVLPSNTRFRRRKENLDTQDQIFHMELELRKVRRRRNFQLWWARYAVSTRREHWTHFELQPSKFPPFAFSRVRGYTAETTAPLLT